MRTLLMMLLALPASSATFEQQLVAARRQMLPGQDEQRRTALMTIAADKAQPESARLDAIKELRRWTPTNAGANALIAELVLDKEESLPIRLRGLKSLGMAIVLPAKQYEDTLSVLLPIARDEQQPLPVRVMAAKAAHWAAALEPWVRREMIMWTAPSQPLGFKVAALWSLASGVEKDAEVERFLSDFAGRRSLEHAQRLQALKSLFAVSEKREVYGLALTILDDKSEETELRENAALFLSGAVRFDAVRKALEGYRDGGEARLSAAARTALDPAKMRDLWVYFRLRYDPVAHNRIDVLELE